MLGDFGDAAERGQYACRFDWQHQHFLIRRLGELSERFEIFLRNEIVERRYATVRHRFTDHRGCLGFSLGEPLSCFGIPEGRFAPPLRLQDLRLLLTLGPQNLRLALSLRREDLRAFLTLRL